MSCSQIPTATEYTTVVTNSVSTSFSNEVTTLPASVTTITSESCLASATASNSTGCISSTEITITSTIDAGSESTVQAPFAVTIPVTQTQATATLYSTSCSSGASQPPSLPPSSPPPSSQGSSTTLSTSVLSTTTPTSTFTTSSATTLADGSVSYAVSTITSTGTPSAIYVPTSVATSLSNQGSSNHSNVALAPIIGGTVGGVVGLLSLIGIIWLIWRRRRYNFDDLFDNGPDDTVAYPVRRNKSRNLDLASEPKPYQYGLVGASIPPVSADSHNIRISSDAPPQSPPLDARTTTTSSSAHVRGNSLSPLMMPVPGATLSPGPSQPQTASSRPSTSGSLQPLIQTPTPPVPRLGGDGALLNWNPNTDGLGLGSDLGHDNVMSAGSVGTAQESRRRAQLQIANPNPQRPMSPASVADPPRGEKATYRPRRESANVVVHRDGGRAPQSPGPSGSGSGSGTGAVDQPPAYSMQ